MPEMPMPGMQPPATPGGGMLPAPAPSGAAVKQPAAGIRSRSMIDVTLAYKALQRALQGLEPGTSESKAVLKALGSLGGILGGGSSDALTKTEVQSLGAQAPAIPAVGPQQQQAFMNMIRQRQQMQPPAPAQPPAA